MSADLSGEITAIATAALAFLAIVTAVFAVITYVLSGSRVRVDTRFGMDLAHVLPGVMKPGRPIFLTDDIVSGVREVQVADVGGLHGAGLRAAVPPLAGAAAAGYLPPGQGPDLCAQQRLVALDDRD